MTDVDSYTVAYGRDPVGLFVPIDRIDQIQQSNSSGILET